MKRFVSCLASFALAFSLIATPGISYAAEELSQPVSTAMPTEGIDTTQYKNADGTPKQATTSVDLFATGETTDSSETGTVGTEQAEAYAQEVKERGAAVVAAGDSAKGSAVSVTLFTVKDTAPNATSGVKATLKNANFHREVEFVKKTTDLVTVTTEDGEEAFAQTSFEYIANLSDKKFGEDTYRIPAGTYTVEISGPGYLTYSHEFDVEDGNRVNIMLGSNPEDPSLSSYGLIPYGDFNADGKLTNADVRVLTDAVLGGEQNAVYDIDGNAVVDIADLQRFAFSLAENTATKSDSEVLAEVKEVKQQARVTKDVSEASVPKSSAFTMTVFKETTDAATGQKTMTEVVESNKTEAEYAQLIQDALLNTKDGSVCVGSSEKADQAISKDNHVAVAINTGTEDTAMHTNGLVLNYPTTSSSKDSAGPSEGAIVASYVDENGNEKEVKVPFGTSVDAITNAITGALSAFSQKANGADELNPKADIDAKTGQITVDFGSRIAIKKITIVVTATTSKDAKLCEIGTVEFLNKMEDKIAPPELNIPKNLVATPGPKKIDCSWSAESNITGYEITISCKGKSVTQTLFVNKFTLAEWPYSTLKDVKSGIYEVKVRSLNGEWKSPWSDTATAEVVASEKPKRPTAINVRPGFNELVVSWPAVDDADFYNLYYKENDDKLQYIPIKQIRQTSFTLSNLKANTEYILYLTAENKFGASAGSDKRTGITYGDIPVKVPWYNLINRKVQYANDPSNTQYDKIVTKATIGYGHNAKDNKNQYDASEMFDGNYGTGYLFCNQNGAVNFEFDKEYSMNAIVITSTMLSSGMYSAGALYNAMVRTVDSAGAQHTYRLSDGSLKTRDVGKGAPGTFYLEFPTTNVKAMTVEQNRYYNWKVGIAEIAFYNADGFGEDIANLWADDLRTTLKPHVTESLINDLRARVNTPDANGNNELHPKAALYSKELDDAMNVLKNLANFSRVKYFDSSIDNAVNRNVNGINGWQPLGISAHEGQELNLFVAGMSTGNNSRYEKNAYTALRLWICQFVSEPENVRTELCGTLRIGENTVTVPTGMTSLDTERGGQIYVEFLSSTKNQRYGIRTLGGTEISTLDLHGITGTEQAINKERLDRSEAYVKALIDQCNNKDARHNEHKDYYAKYGEATCVANTTDIVLDDMMYSVPATRILAGLGNPTNSSDKAAVEAAAQKLNTALASMDYMMELFYQHKGLTHNQAGNNTYGTNNGIPKGHLNMRTMRMKDGVFMYAAGNHIGIPVGSSSLSGAPAFVYDKETGEHESGAIFGWGIAHEIGHNINQGQYTIAEVTNNYYAQLITNTATDNSTSRFAYQGVYNRVTSGTYKALAGKTGIAAYWQLHLAFDKYYSFKLFDNYTDQMANLIFGRMDAYARNPAAAPVGETVKYNLSLSGCNTDNALARLAMAATKKDLTAYFDAYGLKMNDGTKQYGSQFPKEERLIQYVSDDSHAYVFEGGESVADDINLDVKMKVAGEEITTSKTVNSREINFEIKQTNSNVSNDQIIGYEITRNGKAVAFKELATATVEDGVVKITENIQTVNNRTFIYGVRAVDKTLKASSAVTFPEIKVSDPGTYADKDKWTISTNMESAADQVEEPNVETTDATTTDLAMPCEQEKTVDGARAIIDNNKETKYEGALPKNGTVRDSESNIVENSAPYIQIDTNGEKQMTALRVPAADVDTIMRSRITVTTDASLDPSKWTAITPRTNVANDDGTVNIYFDGDKDPQLKVYTMSSVRITGNLTNDKSGSMTLHEIDIVGVTGDNADWLKDSSFGKLTKAVTYAPEPADKKGEYTIPAGSYVFIGSYTGDTAYNGLKMFDQNGDLVPGTQVFFADAPGEGSQLGKTADGRWIWYMTAQDVETYKSIHNGSLPTQVKLTLYRVDDALTLKNERGVADTMKLDVNFNQGKAIELKISGDYNDVKLGNE